MAVKMETEATTLPAQERKPQETIDSSSRGDIPLRWVTSILLLIFPTATLFVNRGDSYVLGLLTLIGIWVWLRDGARRWLDRPSALLWIAFALFFAVALLSYLLGTQTDAGFRFLGRYLRFLLIAPVYLAVRRYLPTAKTVFIGLALGAFLAGVIGGLHFLHAAGAIRVEATTGLSIIFGDLATTMTLCAVAGFGLLALSRRKWVPSLLVLCIAGGIVATLLSGTRGAWIPLLVLIPALVISAASFPKRGYWFVTVLALITVFSSFYAITRTGTHGRIKEAFQSTRDYFVARHILSEGLQHCDAQKPFVMAWSHFNYLSSNQPPSGLSVVKDLSIGQSHICRGEYSVRMQNHSRTEWAGYEFPRMLKGQTGVQTSVVLARGSGTIVLGKADYAKIPFNSARYVPVAFKSAGWNGEHIGIYVPPGGTAWVVPVDSYYGEYTLTIADTSVGQRFEMWRAAWAMFLQRPLLGVGTGAYQDTIDLLINNDNVAPFVKNFDHPHNDYLNALASSGITGFVALIAILFMPLRRFWRAVRSANQVTHAVGMAGLLTVMSFAIYALTDTIFLHSMMITWYVIYMALFYAVLNAQASKLAKPPLPTP